MQFWIWNAANSNVSHVSNVYTVESILNPINHYYLIDEIYLQP